MRRLRQLPTPSSSLSADNGGSSWAQKLDPMGDTERKASRSQADEQNEAAGSSAALGTPQAPVPFVGLSPAEGALRTKSRFCHLVPSGGTLVRARGEPRISPNPSQGSGSSCTNVGSRKGRISKARWVGDDHDGPSGQALTVGWALGEAT